MYVHLFKYCTHSFEVLGTLVTSYFAYFMLLMANEKKKTCGAKWETIYCWAPVQFWRWGIVYTKMIYVNIELNGVCESNIFT